MPAGNGTGPNGMGPMTGRGAGYCAGYSTPGYANPVGGRGFFRRGMGGGGRGFNAGMGFGGRGRGFGYRNMVPNFQPGYSPAQMNPQNELEALKNQAKLMQDEMEFVNKRIQELESKTSE